MIPSLAIVAVIAGNVVVCDDSVRFFEIGYTFPYALDGPADFVAEDTSWSVSAMDLFDVCPANSRGCELDQDFAWLESGNWNLPDLSVSLSVD
jgi:hypothetical protein